MKLSIIIVTYFSTNIIKNCLNSILNYSDLQSDDFEIIIVDNSTNEEFIRLSQIIDDYQIEIKLLQSGGNLGYGHANNIGIRHCSAEFVAIMNPDIILTEALFKECIYQFHQDKSLALLGFKQKGGKDLSFYIRAEFFIPVLMSLLVKVSNRLNFFNSKYMFLSGAFFFTRKASFMEVGMFDQNIFLYSEESDITQRILKSNYKIKFLKKKTYLHNHGDRSEVSLSSVEAGLKSVLYYLDKYKKSTHIYLYKLLIDLKIKWLFALLLKKNAKKRHIQNTISVIHKLIE